MNISNCRLYNQHIASPRHTTAAEVVASLGAMQGQDYPGTLWAMGLRLPSATESDIKQAIADREIVRTWPMRGTLHFVAAADIRWMLELLSPRVIAGSASRYKKLELDEKTFTRCHNVFEQALSGGGQLARDEMFDALQQAGIPVDKQRGYHILRRAGQDRIICFGPLRGKQETFVLLDEWIPASARLHKDEAAAGLALRYFNSHGPATLEDFVWWSGLKISDARAAIEEVRPRLASERIDSKTCLMSPDTPDFTGDAREVYLLPGFDEFMLGYKDRSAALDPEHAQRICPGNNGMFSPTIVVDGRIAGTWKRTARKNGILITPDLFPKKTCPADDLHKAAKRYGAFMGMTAGIAS